MYSKILMCSAPDLDAKITFDDQMENPHTQRSERFQLFSMKPIVPGMVPLTKCVALIAILGHVFANTCE